MTIYGTSFIAYLVHITNLAAQVLPVSQSRHFRTRPNLPLQQIITFQSSKKASNASCSDHKFCMSFSNPMRNAMDFSSLYLPISLSISYCCLTSRWRFMITFVCSKSQSSSETEMTKLLYIPQRVFPLVIYFLIRENSLRHTVA